MFLRHVLITEFCGLVNEQIQSTGLMEALGLRTQVLIADALQLLRYWSQAEGFFEARYSEDTPTSVLVQKEPAILLDLCICSPAVSIGGLLFQIPLLLARAGFRVNDNIVES